MNLYGTPFTAYLSLTNGALGPTAFAIFVNGAAFTLGASDRLYITNITASSNDTAQALVTIDDGVGTAQKLMSTYLSNVQPPAVEQIPAGACRLRPAVLPRGTATAITAAKTVELVIKGYISKT